MRSRRIFAAIALVVFAVSAPSPGATATASQAPKGGAPRELGAGSASVSVLEEEFGRLQAVLQDTGALGVYVRDDGRIAIVVPASGSSRFHASDAAALGIPVVVETSAIEPQDLVEIRRLVAEVEKTAKQPDEGFVVAFQARTGKIIINTDLPTTDFAEPLGSYLDEIEFRPGVAPASRMEDYNSHWGGARMDGPDSWCTSGFSVKNSAGNPRMVTAGHCFEVGDQVDSPFGDSFGEVKKRRFLPVTSSLLVGWGQLTDRASTSAWRRGRSERSRVPRIRVRI